MSLTMIILIVLVLVLVFGLPLFPHSRGFGWGPSGIVGVLLLILVVLLLTGQISL